MNLKDSRAIGIGSCLKLLGYTRVHIYIYIYVYQERTNELSFYRSMYLSSYPSDLPICLSISLSRQRVLTMAHIKDVRRILHGTMLWRLLKPLCRIHVPWA